MSVKMAGIGGQEFSHETVCVVTSTHGDGKRLLRAWESLQKQQDPHWIWLLLDDGSPPDAGTDLLPDLPEDRVLVRRYRVRKGKAHRLNEALASVSSPWWLEMDGDDWLFPDTIAAARRLIRRHPQAGVIYGDRFLYIPQGQDQVRPLRWWRGCSYPGRTIWRKNPIPFGPRLYQAAALREAGGWPEQGYGRGQFYEDIELLDVLLNHYPSLYSPELRDCVLLHHNGLTARHRDCWEDFLRYLRRR